MPTFKMSTSKYLLDEILNLKSSINFVYGEFQSGTGIFKSEN